VAEPLALGRKDAKTRSLEIPSGSSGPSPAEAPATDTRAAQQRHAMQLMAESQVRRDPFFDEAEAQAMRDREAVLQRGLDVLESTRNMMMVRLPQIKKLQPLDKLKLDMSSPLGRPRRLRPDKPAKSGRVGGSVGGRLAVGAQHKRKVAREGPPPRLDTPELVLGGGEAKPSIQTTLGQ
jgi:hypothetical protein